MIKIPELEHFTRKAVDIYEEIRDGDKRHACLIIAKALLNEYAKGADDVSVNALTAIDAQINRLQDKQ